MCPRGLDQLYSKLLYKIGQDFLDRQYTIAMERTARGVSRISGNLGPALSGEILYRGTISGYDRKDAILIPLS